MTQFTTIDIAIVIAYMIMLVGVGIWTAKRTKTTEDFMVAGRNIGIWRFTAAMAACVLGGALTRNHTGIQLRRRRHLAWRSCGIQHFSAEPLLKNEALKHENLKRL